jgi:hypothetical protein
MGDCDSIEKARWLDVAEQWLAFARDTDDHTVDPRDRQSSKNSS